jgi:uncharacterized repeat protein (TIGR03803 family)
LRADPVPGRKTPPKAAFCGKELSDCTIPRRLHGRVHGLGITVKTGISLLVLAVTANFVPVAGAQEAATLLPTLTVLHDFAGAPGDGADPSGPPLLGIDGSYFGLTTGGGAFDKGAIYRRSPDGNVSVVYSFAGGADGGLPSGAMALDAQGNLYGTAATGGDPDCGVANGCGVVFKLSPDGTQTVLHAFSGVEGASPQNGVILDGHGNLYGTAQGGGDMSCDDSIPGCGVAFKLALDGTYTVLHAFTVSPAGSSAAYPSALLRDSAGNLYGTVTWGVGPSGNSDGIFKLEPDGSYSIPFTFADYATQGRNPLGGLVKDPAGNLYGVTFNGGAHNQGVVYRLTPSGRYTVLHAFTGDSDGRNPQFALFRSLATGLLYGTAFEGGSLGCGTVYVLNPNVRNRFKTLYNFGCTGTAFPVFALIQGRQGRELIGASFLGTENSGSLYSLRLGFGGQ